MNPNTRLLLLLFGVVYLGSALLVLLGITLGVACVLWAIATLITLIVLLVLILISGPLIYAGRAFAKYCPPRSMYERLSSRSGYCRFAKIPKWFIIATVCGEDHMFYKHKGINCNSLLNALAHNLSSDKRIGGSTITQQLIKNVYLSPDATMKRKISELLMVRRVEKELSKNEIIELYANVIYYGFGKYGITSAAEFYYHCQPCELTFDQCLSLAAILPCPDKYNEQANPRYHYEVRQKLLRKILYFSNMTFDQLAALHLRKESGENPSVCHGQSAEKAAASD